MWLNDKEPTTDIIKVHIFRKTLYCDLIHKLFALSGVFRGFSKRSVHLFPKYDMTAYSQQLLTVHRLI